MLVGADGAVVVAVGPAQPGDELAFAVVDRERATQARGGDGSCLAQAKADQVTGDSVGVGMQAFPEKGLHLVLADLRSGWHPPQVCHDRIGEVARDGPAEWAQAVAHPHTWGFAFGAVVIGQTGAPTLGGICGGDLPDQVHVPVSGGQLVQAHHRDITTHRLSHRLRRYATAVANEFASLSYPNQRAVTES